MPLLQIRNLETLSFGKYKKILPKTFEDLIFVIFDISKL